MRRISSIITGLAVVATSLVGASAPAEATPAVCAVGTGFAGGSGTSYNDPFLVSTPEQLAYLVTRDSATTTGKFYRLTQNIDFQGCRLANSFGEFSGNFNGNGLQVSNYFVTQASESGLFARARGGVIANLKIDNATISGSGAYKGALAGATWDGTLLNNITVKNSTVSGSIYVGGVSGGIWQGAGGSFGDLRVIDSKVYAEGSAGGIAGGSSGFLNITRIGAFGTTVERTGTLNSVAFGGLFGMVNSDGGQNTSMALSDSAFRGQVNIGTSVTSHAGLLIGENDDVTITAANVYAMGTIQAGAGSQPSGLVGGPGTVNMDRAYVRAKFLDSSNGTTALTAHPFKSGPGTLSVAYLDTTIHNNWVSVPAGAGRTTQEMKTATTYVNFAYTTGTAAVAAGSIGNSGWYFSSMIDGGFMGLMWEYWGNPIVPCPIGKYSYNGIENCTNAPPGTFVAFTGSFAASDCPAGTFQASFGAGECTPAAAGSFVSAQRQVAPIPCPPGTFQPSVGQVACLDANPGFFATGPGAATETACPAGTTSQAQATFCTASAQYAGPRLAGSGIIAYPGKVVSLSGAALGTVSSALVRGKQLEIVSKTDISIALRLPVDAALGIQDLVLTSDAGVVTIQGALRVVSQTSLDAASDSVSIKRIGNKVRLFATDVVGAGKIQFKINGKEIGWVRAVDETDPKLRNANGRAYFVRLAGLASGKNSVEIYVDGTRVKRAAYTR